MKSRPQISQRPSRGFLKSRRLRTDAGRELVGTFQVWITAAAIVTWAFGNSSLEGKSQELSADALLKAYQQAIPVFDRIAFTSTIQTSVEGAILSSPERPWLARQKYRRDHDRLDVDEENVRLNEQGQPAPFSAQKTRSILNGDRWYHFTSYDNDDSKELMTSANTDRWGRWTRQMLSAGTAIDGYLPGDDEKTVWQIMREAPSLKLRPEMEVVDGHRTHVLEARGQYGEYTLWLDPEAGYHARRIFVRKTGADLLDGKPVDSPPPPLPEKAQARYPQVPVEEYTFTMDAIQIENLNGVFFPVRAALTARYLHQDGSVVTFHRAHERSEINTNPDFEAMGAFSLAFVPDGTPVYDQDLAGTGVQFEWQKGKIVPKFDAPVLEYIDEAVHQELTGQPRGDAIDGQSARAPQPAIPAVDQSELSGTPRPLLPPAHAPPGNRNQVVRVIAVLTGLGGVILGIGIGLRFLRPWSRSASGNDDSGV